ncbi:MAG: hypothetical protein MJ252_09015 [archaeon]|nr:hypothetical protein [archaeon]
MQKEKLNELNKFSIPKPTENATNSFQSSGGSSAGRNLLLMNRLKKNKEENANMLKNIGKPEAKVALSTNLAPPPSIAKEEESKKEEKKEEEKKEENVPRKFGLPELDGAKKSKFMQRLSKSRADLKKAGIAKDIIKTSEEIMEKANKLQGKLSESDARFANKDTEIKQVEEKEVNAFEAQKVNLADLINKEAEGK